MCDFCRTTCGWCRGPIHLAHEQCPVRLRAEKLDIINEIVIYLSRNVKKCPSCRTPIFKNGGCPHMTCSKPCMYQFCWNCMRKWSAGHICPVNRTKKVLLFPFFFAASVVVALPLSFMPFPALQHLTNGKPLALTWLEVLGDFWKRN